MHTAFRPRAEPLRRGAGQLPGGPRLSEDNVLLILALAIDQAVLSELERPPGRGRFWEQTLHPFASRRTLGTLAGVSAARFSSISNRYLPASSICGSGLILGARRPR